MKFGNNIVKILLKSQNFETKFLWKLSIIVTIQYWNWHSPFIHLPMTNFIVLHTWPCLSELSSIWPYNWISVCTASWFSRFTYCNNGGMLLRCNLRICGWMIQRDTTVTKFTMLHIVWGALNIIHISPN